MHRWLLVTRLCYHKTYKRILNIRLWRLLTFQDNYRVERILRPDLAAKGYLGMIDFSILHSSPQRPIYQSLGYDYYICCVPGYGPR